MFRTTTSRALAMSAALLCAAAAPAQTIFQCGEGLVFSDKPCPGGQAYAVEVDRPDAGRRREADEVAAREARLADRLRSERLERDAAPAAGPAGFHAAAAATPAAEPAKRKAPKTVRTKSKKKIRMSGAEGSAAAPLTKN